MSAATSWLNILKAIPYTCYLALLVSCQADTGKPISFHTINGISFVAANEVVTHEDIKPMQDVGANWVSLMPYGFVRENENRVQYNLPWQWWGETDTGLRATTMLAKKAGLKVMIKPQVWFRHGEYTGAYVPPDSAKAEFIHSFRGFVMHYAKIAQQLEVELYCIGTEWHQFVETEPEFWLDMIKEVRTVYQGKLTYAANWDEYTTVPFWHKLDYIGVNAYFPLVDDDYPLQEDIELAWQPWISQLQALASTVARPILFTEYGYRSIINNTHQPWESYTRPVVSLTNQEEAYRALYTAVWQQPWFAGGFVWKWFHNHAERGGPDNGGFSPQNKPVEQVIKDVYSIDAK